MKLILKLFKLHYNSLENYLFIIFTDGLVIYFLGVFMTVSKIYDGIHFSKFKQLKVINPLNASVALI